MGITGLFIRRPVMTTLVIISLLAAGVAGYLKLPTSDLPPVDYPTITVSASMPGASPETVAASLAAPLESALADVSGLATMTSSSSTGTTSITLTFNLDRDINNAAQDVQAAINTAQLPNGLPNPPTFRKANSSSNPVFYLTLRSDILPLTRVNQLAKDFVSLKIGRITGVSQVVIYGERKHAVRIQVDPKKLMTHGLSITDVSTAVTAENSNLPGGSLLGKYSSPSITSDGQLEKSRDYASITLVSKQGNVLKISQVGRALDSVADNQTGSWWKGEPAITLAVQRQPGSNTVEVVNQIKAMLPEIEAQLPPSVKLEVLMDGSIPIRESVADVQFTLALAIALVVLVVALFLKKIAATVITSLAVPTSLVTTFAVMSLLNYSLDTLSLMALTLSVGFVVDDAIVMLENIVRHMDMGKKPMQAALEGGKEITFTVISTTLSLIAVFLPIAFVSGMIGRLLTEFAMTITVAIILSTVVALSLTPMLCSRFLKPRKKEEREEQADPSKAGGALYRVTFRGYRRMLGFFLKHRLIALAVGVVFLAANVHLFMVVPKGFIPSQDSGYFMGYAMARQGISFDDMSKHVNAVAATIAEDPAIKGVLPLVGMGPMNQGMLVIMLKPQDERAGINQVMARLRGKVNGFPGVMVFMNNPPPITVGAGGGRANYQYTMVGTDTAELYKGAQEMTTRLRGMKELVDVSNNLMIASPQVMLTIDREKAAQLGVTAQALQTALYSAYTSRRISVIYAASDQYDVLLELLPEFRADMESLNWLYIRSQGGSLVPLPAVARAKQGLGPVQVNHFGQLPSVDISFNLRPGVALDAATAKVSALAREVLPTSVSGSFQGSAGEFQKSLVSLGILMLVSLAVIYLILGVLYESFIHPITILAGLPAATAGGILTLLIFGRELDLYGFVGILLLIGIVKKNAIMMVDFALAAQRDEGKNARDAIMEGALVRFRPIMMTSMASFMGILPVAMGIGAGGDTRQPLGLAVCGGLIVSQFVTLLITPVIFTYFDALAGEDKERPVPAKGGEAEPAATI